MLSLLPTKKADSLYPTRPALQFAFLNALSWQVAFGTPMVLFAQHLGASPSEVGFAYSFMALMTPLQVICTVFLPRFGFRKITLFGWAGRAPFLLVPLVLAIVRPEAGSTLCINLLIASVFFFTTIRACGMAALTGWIYSFVPADRRGQYFSIEQLCGALGGVAILVFSSATFHIFSFFNAILIQYIVAFVGNVLSVWAIARFPRVEIPKEITVEKIVRDTPRYILQPGPFRSFLWLSAVWLVLVIPLPAFAAYYLKAISKFSPGAVMGLEVQRYFAVGVGAWVVHRVIDPWGTRAVFRIAFASLIVVLAYWWTFLYTGWGGYLAVSASYLLFGFATVCWVIAAAEYLARVMHPGEHSMGVPIYGAVTFVCGGVAPIVLGLFLKSPSGFSVPAFRAYFIVELVVALVLGHAIVNRLDWSKRQSHPVRPVA